MASRLSFRSLYTQAEDSFRLRVFVLGLVVCCCLRYWPTACVYLQVQRYEALPARAETNRTAVVPIVPNRVACIVDRNGIVLATNYSAYTLEITRSQVEDLEATIQAISEIVPISARDRRQFKRLMADSKSFESLPLRSRLTDEEVARFTAQRWRFPGVDVKARLFRTYPLGEVAGHVAGYIGRINTKSRS